MKILIRFNWKGADFTEIFICFAQFMAYKSFEMIIFHVNFILIDHALGLNSFPIHLLNSAPITGDERMIDQNLLNLIIFFKQIIDWLSSYNKIDEFYMLKYQSHAWQGIFPSAHSCFRNINLLSVCLFPATIIVYFGPVGYVFVLYAWLWHQPEPDSESIPKIVHVVLLYTRKWYKKRQ